MVQANNFDFYMLSWSTDRDNSAHNHKFLIGQTQKQEVAAFEEDACYQNGKHSTPPSPMSFTHQHYYHTTPHHTPLYIFHYSHTFFQSIFLPVSF